MHSPCLHCGKALRPRRTSLADFPGTALVASRGLCRPCWGDPEIAVNYERWGRPRDETLEEVRLILQARNPSEVAKAMGMTKAGIAQAAYRDGDLKMARLFWRKAA